MKGRGMGEKSGGGKQANQESGLFGVCGCRCAFRPEAKKHNSDGAENQTLPLIRAGSNGIMGFAEPSKNAYGVCLTTLAA
jgi:hypothetical protein